MHTEFLINTSLESMEKTMAFFFGLLYKDCINRFIEQQKRNYNHP